MIRTVADHKPSEVDVALVLESYEYWERGDIESAVQPLHPEVEWVEPAEFPGGGARRGPVAVAEYLRESRASWRELHSERQATVVGADVVVVHHVHGTLIDGTAHSGTVADVYTVRDGQVVRMRAYADPNEPFRGAD